MPNDDQCVLSTIHSNINTAHIVWLLHDRCYHPCLVFMFFNTLLSSSKRILERGRTNQIDIRGRITDDRRRGSGSSERKVVAWFERPLMSGKLLSKLIIILSLARFSESSLILGHSPHLPGNNGKYIISQKWNNERAHLQEIRSSQRSYP